MSANTGSDASWHNLHGVALNAAQDTILVTQQIGSIIYRIQTSDPSASDTVHLYDGPVSPSPQLNPHEILYSPDNSKYFVTCQGSSEVRVFQTSTNNLLTIISLHAGSSPTEMSFSTTSNYLFVACTEDTMNISGKRGSVAVINYNTNTLVKYIYTGHQPHGIAVDNSKRMVMVANRNYTTDGPAPHHGSTCGGRNGYVSFIDVNTLEMITLPGSSTTKKIEISVDPYSVGIR